MPSLTQEQITQARETDLLAYLLSHESGVLKREGANYRHREHDSLVYVASKNYWYWNSRGRKINAVDYLMEIRGYSFVDAVERLAGCGTPAVSHYTASGSREQRKPVEKKSFRLPWVKRCATFAVSYLQRRGVHSDIIRRCIQLGLFYESRYNNEAVCVFVGRDDTGTGRFACVRGIAGDLKKDISGSDKRFSFASRTLKAHGMPEQAKEMAGRVFSCDSYHKALCIIGEYVNITSADREAGRPHSIRQQLKNNKAPETAAPKKVAKEPER